MPEQLTHKIEYTIFDKTELPLSIQTLVNSAVEAIKSAYAPYSNFHVGSCVALADGQIITGNNQENAAYPSGLCAERVALFAAKSANPHVAIKAIAIAAKPKDAVDVVAVGSCGNCRQVMVEYEHQQKSPIDIYLALPGQKVMKINSVSDYLPFSFNGDSLLK